MHFALLFTVLPSLPTAMRRATGQALLVAGVCTAFSAPCIATTKTAPDRQTSSVAAEVVGIPVPATSFSPNTRSNTTTSPNAASPPRAMRTLVFKPQGTGPFKVLLFAHGRPAYASQRARLVHPMPYGHVRYWLAKGYAVVAPIRPGYGAASGGPVGSVGNADLESSGAGYSASGQCLRNPSPARTAAAAMQAQRAALDWVRQQPWARHDHIVLEGQSVGGLAIVALCAANPPGVKGCINFSGGAGGDPQHAPGRMCAPEQTTQLMREYGSTTQVPSIWLYAANDLYWGAEPPKQWHAAFAQAAQAAQTASHPAKTGPSTFVQTSPIGSDGHSLLRAGSVQWRPPLEAWLKQNRL
jgi:dienelactone hydrolase